MKISDICEQVALSLEHSDKIIITLLIFLHLSAHIFVATTLLMKSRPSLFQT